MSSFEILKTNISCLNKPDTPFVDQKVVRRNYGIVHIKPFTPGVITHIDKNYIFVLWQGEASSEVYPLQTSNAFLEFTN